MTSRKPRTWTSGLLPWGLVVSVCVATPSMAISQPKEPTRPTVTGYLEAVAAVSPNNAWAVGATQPRQGKTLIEHWNGKAWARVASPSPSRWAELFGVDAISASDIWAVGRTNTIVHHLSVMHTLVEHWDGKNWTVVKSPSPGPLSILHGVSAVSARDIWAVGGFATPDGEFTLIEHWNGEMWKQVPSWSPGPGSIPFLNSVDAISATDAWAVGLEGSETPRGIIEHWNGVKWAHSKTVQHGNALANQLSSVRAASPSDVWAVGVNVGQEYVPRTLVEHWDGATWTKVAGPGDENAFYGLDIVSPTDAWAVGSGEQALTAHWDGHTWSAVENHPPIQGELLGVSARTANDVWAVGPGLTAHWNGQKWTEF